MNINVTVRKAVNVGRKILFSRFFSPKTAIFDIAILLFIATQTPIHIW